MTADEACTAAASKDGGTLNYWTSTDTDVFAEEIKPFQAKYPNIKINYTSLRPVDQVQRIVTEIQAGHALDVDMIAGDLPSFAPLFEAKDILSVDWAKLGAPANTIFTLDGITTPRTYRTVLGLGYNTDAVQESDLPSTWDDLVNAKWSGQVVVDPRGIYLSGLALVKGEQGTVDWFKKIMATDQPQIVNGATASMQKIISGEAQLSTSSHDSEVAEQKSKGAPVAIKYLDIVPTQDWYAQILAKAAHPEAAACFMSWWVSADGMAQQTKYEFRSNADAPSDLPAGSKLVAIDSPDKAKLATDTATQLADLMK
jgi:iron(III) transport system substrate-binding protein